jgi:hypothetical protein
MNREVLHKLLKGNLVRVRKESISEILTNQREQQQREELISIERQKLQLMKEEEVRRKYEWTRRVYERESPSS